jgi:hypothetical protein
MRSPLYEAAKPPMTQPMVRIDDEGKSVWGRGLRSNPEPNSANQFKLGRGLRASPTVTPEIVARNLTTYQIWFNMAAEGRQNGMSFKSH